MNIRRGAGANESDRITITWPDGAIVDRWLRVTFNAAARTRLELTLRAWLNLALEPFGLTYVADGDALRDGRGPGERPDDGPGSRL